MPFLLDELDHEYQIQIKEGGPIGQASKTYARVAADSAFMASAKLDLLFMEHRISRRRGFRINRAEHIRSL
jgi:hypothetical protein